jgi:hypothetical protein
LFLESARRGDLRISEVDSISGRGSPSVEDAAEEIATYEDGFESMTKLALEAAESIELMSQLADEMS